MYKCCNENEFKIYNVPRIVMVPCISTDLIFLPMNTTLTFLSINKLQIIIFLVRNNVHIIKYYHAIIYTIIVISVYYHYNAINFIIYIYVF